MLNESETYRKKWITRLFDVTGIDRTMPLDDVIDLIANALVHVEQLEFVAKAHHDTIVRVQKLAETWKHVSSSEKLDRDIYSEIIEALDGEIPSVEPVESVALDGDQ